MRTKILVIDPLAMLLKDVLLTSSTQGTRGSWIGISLISPSSGHAAMVTILEEISELTYSSGMTTIVRLAHSRHEISRCEGVMMEDWLITMARLPTFLSLACRAIPRHSPP
jgi:hypothetical protein